MRGAQAEGGGQRDRVRIVSGVDVHGERARCRGHKMTPIVIAVLQLRRAGDAQVEGWASEVPPPLHAVCKAGHRETLTHEVLVWKRLELRGVPVLPDEILDAAGDLVQVVDPGFVEVAVASNTCGQHVGAGLEGAVDRRVGGEDCR